MSVVLLRLRQQYLPPLRQSYLLSPGSQGHGFGCRGAVEIQHTDDYLSSSNDLERLIVQFRQILGESATCESAGMLSDELLGTLLETWQTKRDGSKRAYCGDHYMIRNSHELEVTRERVATLERVLEELRKTARPEEWPALSSGYRLEIERMQGEILDYLVEGAPTEATS